MEIVREHIKAMVDNNRFSCERKLTGEHNLSVMRGIYRSSFLGVDVDTDVVYRFIIAHDKNSAEIGVVAFAGSDEIVVVCPILVTFTVRQNPRRLPHDIGSLRRL